jgi:hypothetical protein
VIIAFAFAAAVTNQPRPEIKDDRPRTGSRIQRDVSTPADSIPERATAVMLRKAGDCVVRLQPGVARRVVAASNDYDIDFVKLKIPPNRLTTALSIETCLSEAIEVGMGNYVQWNASRGTIHSFLVGPLYRATFTIVPVRNWALVKAVPMVEVGPAVLVTRWRAVAEFGECVVRADFAAADELVRSEPFTNGEKTAFAKVMPHVSPCLDAGSTTSLNKAALRTLVTAAAWRLATGEAVAPQTPVSGKL